MVKRPTIPIIIIHEGPISRLCPKVAPNFLWQPERICSVNGTESKRAENNEGKEARKKIVTAADFCT